MKKVLCIVAHPDDEIIGCGGALLKHVKNKDQVKTVFVMVGENARKHKSDFSQKKMSIYRKEVAKKVSKFCKFQEPIFLNYDGLICTRSDIVNINYDILKIISNFQPNFVYTHSNKDNHFDHRIVNDAVVVSCRMQNNNKIDGIYAMEIPSATEFSHNNNFDPNHYVNISGLVVKKIKALNFYKKEMLNYPNFRSIRGIENLSKYRGNCVSLNNAESFETIRTINF
jgi:N-acetylglucosamine malate deacetylase 1